ncbi:hypothetical protein ACFMCQ_004937, partial [Salmonella enterica]
GIVLGFHLENGKHPTLRAFFKQPACWFLRDTVQLKEQDKGIKDPLVPYFHEIFPYFLLDRATAKRRRNWLD